MHRYKHEASNLIKLATPFLLASVAQSGMSFVDTIMAGGVSPTDMAAVSIAASIWLPSILFGVGALMALVPIVAQLNGSNRREKIAYQIQQGGFLSLFLAIPILLVLFQTSTILRYMHIEPEMAEKTIGYIHAVMFAVPAFLLFQNLRSFTDGMSLTKPAMIIGFIGLSLNIPLNWMFVYGKWGAPALGGVGCGVATTLVYWAMFLMLLFYVTYLKRFTQINLFEQIYKPDTKAIWRLFKLGFPIAASIFFEVTLFAIVSLLVAPLGALTVAAHQVAINFSTLVYMLPMSIGAAVSIRVGHKLGQKSTDGAIVSSHVGIFVGLSTAFITATLTVLFRQKVGELYTNDPHVIAAAMHLLIFAAIYQCTDAIQVIASGALRGYKDMRSIFIGTFVSYWLVGLPIGYVLGLTDIIVPAMGAQGFWIGFITGLTTAAIILGLRLRWMHQQSEEVRLQFAER